MRHVDAQRIREYGFKLSADYSHGLAADTLADVLSQMGVDVVPLNAWTKASWPCCRRVQGQPGESEIGATFILFGSLSRRVFLVDEKGNVIDDIMAAALMMGWHYYIWAAGGRAGDDANAGTIEWHGAAFSVSRRTCTALCTRHPISAC